MRSAFALVLVAGMVGAPLARAGTKAPTTPAAPDKKCKLTPIGPLDVLVTKAPVATVFAITSTPECRAALVQHARLTLTSSNSHVLAKPVAGSEPNTLELELENVDVPIGAHDWTITAVDGPSLAAETTMSLEVVALETKSMVLSFFADQDGRRQIERKAPDLIAAARVWTGWPDKAIITNAASVAVPDRLIAPAGMRWRLVDSTWKDSFAPHCLNEEDVFVKLPPDPANARCEVRPDRILFVARRRLKTPLVVDLQLWDAKRKRAVVSVKVQLASEARVESLPLPLWRVAKVTCISERLIASDFAATVHSSQTLAIDNDAVGSGKCFLTFDFSYDSILHPADPAEQTKRAAIDEKSCNLWTQQLRRAGPQNVEMTVKRGDSSITRQFQIEPPIASACEAVGNHFEMKLAVPEAEDTTKRTVTTVQEDFKVPLPSPQGDASGNYLVSLKLKGSPEVHYFDGSLDEANIDNSTDATASFVLRPRGAFSTTYPVRVSVTLALTPVSLRVPARARDITSSSSETSAHLEGPRTALMGVFELWNHRSNTNMLPLPVQLQGGLSLLRVEEKPLDLNTLLGGTIAFPFAGEGRTETSISLGMFWEHELMGTHSNALIFTASIDVFKLSVAKPTTSEGK